MKSSKKVLAFALAAAMVVTAVPATNAQAATTTAKLSATKVTVAAGTAKKQAKNIVVTIPSTWKSYKVTTSSSNKSVATARMCGKRTVKVTAVKKGSAKVKVKVTAKKSGKKVSKTLYANAKVIGAGLRFTSAPTDLAVGTEDKVVTKKCPSVAKVTYKSSDDAVATVDANDGTVKAIKAGKVTITATSDYGNEVKTDIAVKKAILTVVKQSKVNQLVATVVGDTKDLKTTDFTITNTVTNATVPVKAVSVDKTDKTKVTIDTFVDMKDAKEYSVVYDGTTQKFTATNGTVANVGLTRLQVPAAEKTDVKAQSLDANGVVIGEFPITNANSAKGQVSTELTISKGYAEDAGVYLPAVGDTMNVKLTYHTGTFGTDGNETGKIENALTITAVDPSLVNYNFQVTIAGNAPAWSATSFKASNDVKIGAERNAYFRILKDDGTEISNYSDYSVESADKTKLLVTNTSLTSKTTPVKVNGVSEGLTYIEIKKDGKVVGTVAVNVKAKPVATSVNLDKTTVTVVRGKTVTESAVAVIKDQYNDDMDVDSAKIECIGAPDDASKTAAATALPTITASGKKATIDVAGNFASTSSFKKGSYTYKVTLKNGDKELTRSFTVTLVESATTQAYELKFNQNKVDTTIGTGSVAGSDYNVTVDVAEMANGGALNTLAATTPVKYTVKTSAGKTIAVVGKNPSDGSAVSATTCAAISGNDSVDDNKLTIDTLASSGAGYKKNIEKGTYVVTAEFYSDYGTNKKPVTVSGSFTIEDTQDTLVSYKLISNDFGTKTVKEAFKDSTLVEVCYDGVKQTITDVADVDGVALSNGGAFVKTVDLYVTISGSNNKVCVKVPVNDQIAVCNGLK